MSNVAINPAAPGASDHEPDAGHGAHAHDPHLAHHFDTPEQQYASAKLGMWIFLGTEILMFGGLFCAYSVYRHNHPDVFSFAHQFLNKWLGAVNTIVLITSSLTMAWAVRSSQLGQSTSLRWLLAVTILGGYIFLGVKSIEYAAKWNEYIFIGPHNQFNPDRPKGAPQPIIDEQKEAAEKAHPSAEAEVHPAAGVAKPAAAAEAHEGTVPAKEPVVPVDIVNFAPTDPNHGQPDAAKIAPTFANTPGLVKEVAKQHEEVMLADMTQSDFNRIYTFFAVYFVMTGLHGLHVVIGMSLIMWVLIRALGPKHVAWAVPLIPGSIGVFLAVVGIIIMASPSAHHGLAWDPGVVLIIAGLIIAVLSALWAALWVPLRRNRSGESEFGPTYFTPVDLVGLYWHLVDLIWIFLFPLLYLIH